MMTATGRLAIIASISAPGTSSYTYRHFLLLQQHAKGFASKLRLYDRLLSVTLAVPFCATTTNGVVLSRQP
jgi:hypothetical protein